MKKNSSNHPAAIETKHM